ncbi:MAG TPA: hypothetical protein VGB98_08715, partial [Pyrinomonadaceae bacterium]|jgi:hypothetical protein
MADNKFSRLDDNQVEELRSQLRSFVSGVTDVGTLFNDPLLAGHSLHTNNHNKNCVACEEPIDPGGF